MAKAQNNGEPGPEAQLGAFLKSFIVDAVRAATAEELPRVLAALIPVRPAVPIEQSYVTRKQAAKITGYSDRTISRAIADGSLKASGLHGDRIKRSELDRWMAESAHGKRSADGNGSEDDEINSVVDRLLNDG
jgi:excisionase family DNA binding protein